MIIQIVSDVHTEFHSDKGYGFVRSLPVEAPILVLPGDFATYHHLQPLLGELCLRWEHVVFVCGNHEYYGTFRGRIHNKLAKLARIFPNFHPLNNSWVVIEGKRILGTTLWWNPRTLDPNEELLVSSVSNDYTQILGYRRWLGDAYTKSEHFLATNIQKGDIVVTHHAPSWMSQSLEYQMYGWSGRSSAIDKCYYNNLNSLIEEAAPSLWIHGHTHEPADYILGSTRIVSAPHGYARSGVPCLDKHIVIEV